MNNYKKLKLELIFIIRTIMKQKNKINFTYIYNYV